MHKRPSEIYFGEAEIEDPPHPARPSRGYEGSDSSNPLENKTVEGVNVAFLTDALQGRNIRDDIAAAANGSGSRLFGGFVEKATGALNEAYPVHLQMVRGGPAAIEQVVTDPNFPARQRVHRNSPALIALQLSAQPQDAAQFKACSEYASFLQWAALRQIAPEHFRERMAKVHLSNCKTYIRGLKKQAREEARSRAAAPTPENADPRPSAHEQAPEPSNSQAAAPENNSTPPPDVSEQFPEASTPPALSPVPDRVPSSPTPPSSPAAVPMAVSAPPDSGVQSVPAPTIAITVIGKTGAPRGLRFSLSQDEAAAATAVLDRQQFHSALHALGELMRVLERPERATRKGQRPKPVLASP